MKPVVWGVLGTARIGVEKVVPALQGSPLVDLRGIASRDLARAETLARRLGIAHAYGSYEALIADPGIEAVYNPLPNHLHVPLTLAAARAGKHVLCEKPFALTADEARQLESAGGHVQIAEAFMVRHHPQWQRVRELVRGGRIGTPRALQAVFTYFNDDPADVRNQRDIGGGGLYDIGCYAIVAARYVFEAEPLRAVALIDRDPTFHTDRLSSGLLDFGECRHLSFTVSTQCRSHQRVTVLGTLGRIEVAIPFNPPSGGTASIRIDDSVETLPPADQYRLMAEEFSRAVRGEKALAWGFRDAIAQMKVIDALWRSERSGGWEAV